MNEPLRVLLVDDEQDFTAAMARALDRRGLEVRCAGSGAEALAALDLGPVDVAVLDVRLPGMDGLELFGHLRRLTPRTAVVFLTGHGTVQEAFASLRQGAFDYLAKPCTVEQLLDVVRRAVGQRPAGDDATGPGPIRLLLVDAERALIDALQPALARQGFDVAVATDQRQALACLADAPVDVALVDIATPSIDGLSLLQTLRQRHPTSEALVLTTHAAVGRAYAAVRAGAYDFLLKPQGVEVLAGKIRRAHARVQARRARDAP